MANGNTSAFVADLFRINRAPAYRHYGKLKSSARTDKLIPASWFMLLMVLMFVLLVNSVLAVFVSPDFLNLFRGLAALLVSVQMSVLAYNVIRRNYLLFIKDGKTEWVEAMPETKLERK
jgi:hypothetical protein